MVGLRFDRVHRRLHKKKYLRPGKDPLQLQDRDPLELHESKFQPVGLQPVGNVLQNSYRRSCPALARAPLQRQVAQPDERLESDAKFISGNNPTIGRESPANN